MTTSWKLPPELLAPKAPAPGVVPGTPAPGVPAGAAGIPGTAGLADSAGLPEVGELSELAELAWAAAMHAGELLRAGAGGVLEVTTKTTATDVVTQMDTAAEADIMATIGRARPNDAALGEEGGSSAGSSGVRWIIDPLDGTVNYLYGQLSWAVSIAAEVAGEVVVGVVVAPMLGEAFAAVRGRGAFLVTASSARRLAVNTPGELGKVLAATGFGYAAARREGQAATLATVLPRVRDIRRAGAAALDLCWVGAGRVDAYYERGVNPWDWAAGALVASEAGATIGGGAGGPSSELVWAIWPGLAPAWRELLLRAGADSDGGSLGPV